MRNVRAWLELNKVFFDVSASVIFGIASLFLAFAAHQVSKAQLELSSRGLEPFLYIDETYVKSPNSDVYDETILKVFNSGANIANVEVFSRTFFVVEYIKDFESFSVYVPILGYYSVQYPTGNPTGEIATLIGIKNNSKFFAIYKDFLSDAFVEKNGHASIRRKTFTRVQFLNASGNQDTTLFDEGQRTVDPWVEKVINSSLQILASDIDQTSADDIFQLAVEIQSSTPDLVR